MRCEQCNTLLFPNIKSIERDKNNNTIIKLQCINPKCQNMYYTSLEYFFMLKNDAYSLFGIYENLQKKDSMCKIPNEMNVIISSSERCGCSWLGFLLSLVHESIFAQTIPWNYEISPIAATKKKFPLPLGWSSVYYASTILLLERGFDKIIILQRDYTELLRAHAITYDPTLYDIRHKITPKFMEKHAPSFYNSYKKSYELVYGDKIDDPRVMRVFLEDLNNSFVETFDKILNFLNFPERGKPICYPIKIDRNWESRSTELPSDANIGVRFETINKIYEEDRLSRRRGINIDEQIKRKTDILEGHNKKYDQYRLRFNRRKKQEQKEELIDKRGVIT